MLKTQGCGAFSEKKSITQDKELKITQDRKVQVSNVKFAQTIVILCLLSRKTN